MLWSQLRTKVAKFRFRTRLIRIRRKLHTFDFWLKHRFKHLSREAVRERNGRVYISNLTFDQPPPLYTIINPLLLYPPLFSSLTLPREGISQQGLQCDAMKFSYRAPHCCETIWNIFRARHGTLSQSLFTEIPESGMMMVPSIQNIPPTVSSLAFGNPENRSRLSACNKA